MNTLNMTVAQLAALPTAADGTLKQGIGTTKLAESLANSSISCVEQSGIYNITIPEGSTQLTIGRGLAYLLNQYMSGQIAGNDIVEFGQYETISSLQTRVKRDRQPDKAKKPGGQLSYVIDQCGVTLTLPEGVTRLTGQQLIAYMLLQYVKGKLNSAVLLS